MISRLREAAASGKLGRESLNFYFIAFTIRSGSNLLCDCLKANGMGMPAEYFQYPYGVVNRELYDSLGVPADDFKAFMTNLLTRRSANRFFGAKVTWDHRNVLLNELKIQYKGVGDMGYYFPGAKWIYLRRRDKIMQAISIWRAIKSDRWTSSSPLMESKPPEYDFFRLLSLLQTLLAEEMMWDSYFSGCGLEPFEIYYEDFTIDKETALSELIHYLSPYPDEIPARGRISVESSLNVQRDAYSYEIKERFLRDMAGIGVAEHWSGRTEELDNWIDFFGGEKWKRR